MDRKFVVSAFCYAIFGLMLGLYMAQSQNLVQTVTHAHFLLVGFLLSFIYGLCHKLWLNNSTTKVAVAQFYAHQVGAAVLLVALFLMFGRIVDAETLGPILGISSTLVFIGLILMMVELLRHDSK